jgi:rhodanese-related sulfurtransferase
LARVGYDHTIGYLAGGYSTWIHHEQHIQQVERLTADAFAQEYGLKPLMVDVRKKSEFDTEHVVGAINIPLNQLYAQLHLIPQEIPFIVYCAGGYRSMIAASILQQNGYSHFKDVVGGYTDIAQTNIARTAYREAITDL